MTGKFEIRTRYIPLLKDDGFGEWIIDCEYDGTLKQPKQMPFIQYSEMVDHFIHDVYTVQENNKDLELYRYQDILRENNIEWGAESMKAAGVSALCAQCVMALIMGAVRADRFCEGSLLNLFKSGCIQMWLERLVEFE